MAKTNISLLSHSSEGQKSQYQNDDRVALFLEVLGETLLSRLFQLLEVKEESEKAGIKLNIQKTKIMASGPISSWQIDG